MRVLVVEDEKRLAAGLRKGLEAEGFAVDVALDGTDGLWMAREEPYDAIVLDVMLPGVDGLRICQLLREAGVWTPILLLTARDADSDQVIGLDAGADDYLTKPFALEELLARLRALLRRTLPDSDGTMSFGDLELNRSTREVRRGERDITLTPTEFSLLELLMRDPGMVLTRDVIADRVWGNEDPPGWNTIDVFVSSLRKKTEEGGEPRVSQTARGVGFVLREAL
jgi:two-component system, OmpR family, response regulator MprA